MDISRRDGLRTALWTLAGLGTGSLPATLLAQGRSNEALLAHVAPELREIARGILAQAEGMPPFSREALPAMREGMKQFARPELAQPAWEKLAIPTRDGAAIDLYVVNRSPGGEKPAILHTHGGGYIFGSAASNLGNLQEIAARLDCVIVSVDYRLAPETGWRGSVEDNYAGLKWLYTHAAELGVDRARIALMGESAGGGHAAILALLARDRGEVQPCFQCLVYPMLDDRTGTRVTPAWPVGALVWTAQSNRFGWEAFLGQEPGVAGVPVTAVPARQADLTGLPPAWIGVGSLDLFVQEDLDYAGRLIDAGVAVQAEVIPGAFHGFDVLGGGNPLARQFTDSKLAALARAFA